MSIELLAQIDEVTGNTYFAANINGQDYRVAASDVLAYMQDGITGDSLDTQYSSPLTGTTVQVADSASGVWLILTPAGTIAALTVKLPPVASVQDKTELLVNTTNIVTAFSMDTNGATVYGGPTSLAANSFFRLRFDSVMQTWYRVS